VKQIQIWIAVCPFDDTVSFTPDNYINFTEDLFEFWFKKIIPILHSKMELKISGVTNKERWTLKKGETYESVLNALWEFQKSLLPDGYHLLNMTDKKGTTIKKVNNNRYDNLIGFFDLPEPFYDPETRIITITQFEEA
jgi:hypothetical protein